MKNFLPLAWKILNNFLTNIIAEPMNLLTAHTAKLFLKYFFLASCQAKPQLEGSARGDKFSSYDKLFYHLFIKSLTLFVFMNYRLVAASTSARILFLGLATKLVVCRKINFKRNHGNEIKYGNKLQSWLNYAKRIFSFFPSLNNRQQAKQLKEFAERLRSASPRNYL